ncbi:MAG: HEAT repeat domain-containing protein, partial [Planctomycetota bacterium]
MRTIHRISLLLFLAPVAAISGEKPFDEARIWSTERRLVAELSLVRREKGLPPLVWCEKMALPMRLHLDALMAAGYRGEGAAPAHVGRVSARAVKSHGWKDGEIFANYGTARADDYDPREQVTRMLTNPDVKRSFTDARQNAGAAVLRPMEAGKVFVYLAVSRIDAAAVAADFDTVATVAFRIASGSKELKSEGFRQLAAFPTFEGAPLYRDLLGSKDAEARTAATRALGALGDPSCIPSLIEALEDSESSVRDTALAGLRAITSLTDRSAKEWRIWWEGACDEFKPVGRLEVSPPAAPSSEGADTGEKPAGPPTDPSVLEE